MPRKLEELLEHARKHQMTAEEITEQRVGFAYGNASSDDQTTKDEVRAAVTTSKLPQQEQ